MTTKRQAIRSVVFNWVGRACSMLIALVVTPVLVSRLGNEFYGLWSIVMSVTNYYALADLGLRGATVKFLAEFHAVGDKRSIACVLRTLMVVYVGLGALVIFTSLMVAWLFPRMITIEHSSVTAVRYVIVLLGCNVATQLVGNVFGATLESLKRFDISNVVGVIMNVLQSGLVVLAISLGTGLIGMAVAMLAVGVISQSTQWCLAMGLLGEIRIRDGVFNRETLSRLFSFSSMNVVVNGARRLLQYGGSLLVGALLGPAVVTFYSLAEGLVRHVGNVGKGVSTVVMPISSELQAQGRNKDLAEVLVQVPRVLLGIGLCFAVMFYLLGDRIINVWIGPGYGAEVFPILKVLSVLLLVDLVSGGLHQLLAGMGRMRFLAAVATIECVLVMCLSVPLILATGVVGMAWGLVLGRTVTTGFLLPFIACREIGYDFRRFLFRVIVTPFLGAIPALTLGYALIEFVPDSGVLVLAAMLLGVGAVGAVGIFFASFDRQMRGEVLRALLPRGLTSAYRRESTGASGSLRAP